MKFDGNFEVTKQLTGKQVSIATELKVKDVKIEGVFAVGSEDTATIDLGTQPVLNTNTTVEPNILLNQQASRTLLTDVIHRTSPPTASDGKNGDMCFEGILEDVPGAPMKLEFDDPTKAPYCIATDGVVILATSNTGAGGDHVYIWRSTDGKTWEILDTGIENSGNFTNIVHTDAGFVLIPETLDKSATKTTPHYSEDGGNTWIKSTYTGSGGNAAVQPVASGNVVVAKGMFANKPAIYSTDGGKTFHDGANIAHAGYSRCLAIHGTTVWLISSKNELWRSTNSGANWSRLTTYSLWGGGPGVYALDASRLVSWQGSALFYSTNGGSSWTPAAAPGYGFIYGAVYIPNTNTMIISGKDATNKALTLKSDNTLVTWSKVNDNLPDYASGRRNMIRYNDTMVMMTNIGGAYQKVMNAEATLINGLRDPEKAYIKKIHIKTSGKWLPFKPDIVTAGDKVYLQLLGGTVAGELSLNDDMMMQSHLITNVAAPEDDSDAVNKEYIDSNVSASSGSLLESSTGTSLTVVDTVESDIEAIRYTISGKKDTKRYYSQMNVIADGTNEPTYAEYSVLNLGGLVLDCVISKNAENKTVLTITSNESDTKIYIKREVIDL